LRCGAASLREIKKTDTSVVHAKSRVADECRPVPGRLCFGDEQRQDWLDAGGGGRAILAHGGSKQFWGRGDWDADALRDIVRNYVIEAFGG